MSTHRNIDRICVVIIALSLLVTVVFMNGKALGIGTSSRTMSYEETLFDTSRVHTVEIVIDDWDAFIETCESETYSACSVVIDNEAVKNVAIRGKGNTSLSTVKTLGSERYSFKIEFDHYEDGKSYHGLDKLSLNNLIQDNTYMKDYLAYRLMAAFGVDAPLCSFVWITVNGEDWGLYLAVEGVEDSFLERNYGRDTGELYKPDSMSFGGGGPGNGKDFNMDDFLNRDSESGDESASAGFSFDFGGSMPEGFDPSQMTAGGDMPEGFDPSQMTGGRMPGFGGGDASGGGGPSFDFGGAFGGMGSTDVKLQYIDDDPDSYSNIFGNAKTDVNSADQARLIQSLKKLSSYEDLESVVDVDEVIRYFVVHNYVCNGDSYTGSIIHNYYLHESDGQLSMIPWDYNLAFGTFQSADATDVVNDPIDSPMSVSDADERPMWGWILSSEEYTDMYHAYFAEFLETVDITGIIDEAYALIREYVAKDPTAFCSYDEFETGVETLRSFCELRTESVKAQLDGTIPTTDAGQRADSSALIDASAITISDMGSMGGGGGGSSGESSGFPGGGTFPGGSGGSFSPPEGSGGDSSGSSSFPGGNSGSFPGGGSFSFPGENAGSDDSSDSSDSSDTQQRPGGGSFSFPSGGGGSFSPPDSAAGFPGQSGGSGSAWLLVGLSALILIAGLLVAIRYRRRG